MNSKLYLQAEHVKTAVFVGAASDCIQSMACVENLPDKLKMLCRGMDEVLTGVRDLLDDIERHIDKLPDDSIVGNEIEDC